MTWTRLEGGVVKEMRLNWEDVVRGMRLKAKHIGGTGISLLQPQQFLQFSNCLDQ